MGGSGSLVSANAYMLVYRAVGLQEPPPARTVEELPAALQAAVAEVAAAYADECDVYQRQRDALKTQVSRGYVCVGVHPPAAGSAAALGGRSGCARWKLCAAADELHGLVPRLLSGGAQSSLEPRGAH